MARRLPLLALSAPLIAAGLVTVAPAASAAPSACDAYSGVCAPAPTGVAPERVQKPPVRVAPGRVTPVGVSASGATQLPFTGAELTLVVALGLGGVGVGTALSVAGRRRRAPQPA